MPALPWPAGTAELLLLLIRDGIDWHQSENVDGTVALGPVWDWKTADDCLRRSG